MINIDSKTCPHVSIQI